MGRGHIFRLERPPDGPTLVNVWYSAEMCTGPLFESRPLAWNIGDFEIKILAVILVERVPIESILIRNYKFLLEILFKGKESREIAV